MKFLKDIVEIYSPTGHEEEIAHYLQKAFEKYGFDAHIDPVGNVIAEREGQGPRILLAGHMDTVPGKIPVRIENGELWGRGAVDAKSPLGAMFFAFLETPANLVFAGLVEEEGLSKGARNLRIKPPDFIVIGEPSGTIGVTIGYKGSLTLRFQKRIEKFHTSLGNIGPAESLIEKWNRISQEFENSWDKPSGRIIEFCAGEREFDYYAEMKVNIRIPHDYKIPDIGERGEIIDYVPAYEVSPRSPLVRAFVRAIRRQGMKPVLKRKSGTADMNILAPKFGVDAVAYGPGNSKLDHTPYEHVNLEEYLQSIEILRNSILYLCEMMK